MPEASSLERMDQLQTHLRYILHDITNIQKASQSGLLRIIQYYRDTFFNDLECYLLWRKYYQ